MSAALRRQGVIRDLLERGPIASQEKLQEVLAKQGIAVAQATLSRDLRDMGIVKGPRGYVTPAPGQMHENNHGRALGRTLSSFLMSAETADSMAVLKTGPGQAQVVALEIDKSAFPGVIGTVAGDDTVFVATRTSRIARRLVDRLKSSARLNV